MKIPRPVVVLATALAVLALDGCLPPDQQARADTDQKSEQKTVLRLAGVERIEIVVLETEPVQVRVAVYGWMSDACTSIRDFEQSREGNVISLKIITTRPADVMCAQVIKRFRDTYPVETKDLPPGEYTLDVNGNRKRFTLP